MGHYTCDQMETERYLTQAAAGTHWLRLRLTRSGLVDHIYTIHMPISWGGGSSSSIGALDELEKGMLICRPPEAKVLMAGSWSMDAKNIWSDEADIRHAAMAEFVQRRHGIPCAGERRLGVEAPGRRRLDSERCGLLRRLWVRRRRGVPPSRSTGRSDHGPVVLRRHGRRAAVVRVQARPPSARLQKPCRWQDITMWKDTLDVHARSAENCDVMQTGLICSVQALQANNASESYNFEDEEHHKRFATYGAKRAALRDRARPRGDPARLHGPNADPVRPRV